MFKFIRSRLNEKNDPTRSEYGFTLIELLVVIIIIGILAAIAIPAFMNQKKRAVDTQTISDVRNVQLAVNTWMVDNPASKAFTNADRPQIMALSTLSRETTVTLWGTTDDYCIKAWNANGMDYRSNGGPYLVYVSKTGKLGNSQTLGHASQMSCGDNNNGIHIAGS